MKKHALTDKLGSGEEGLIMLKCILVRGQSLRELQLKLAPLLILFGLYIAGNIDLLKALLLLARFVGERRLTGAFA